MTMMEASLGEVAEFVRGVTFKPDDVVELGDEGSVACLRTKNVQTELDLTDVWAIPRRLVKSADRFVREGDIVISTANSWNLVGKVSWIPRLEWEATAGGFVCLLRANPHRVFPRYLYHWIITDETQANLRKCARQTTNIANLSIPQAQELAIPLPPLEEQRRIAAILDQADALRRLRSRALDKLNTLGQAIFHEMFGGLRLESLPLSKLGRVSTGSTPSTKIAEYFDGEVPFITPGDLESDRPVVRYLSELGAEKSRTVEAGATLVCCIGATIGKMGVARQRSAFNQQINAVEWGPKIIPEYGYFAVQGIRREVQRLGKGASTTLPILKKSLFEQLTIPVAPEADQTVFADRFRETLLQVTAFEQSLKKADHLFASLQHRAFKGEL